MQRLLRGNGILVQSDNIKEMQEAILRLLQSMETQQMLGIRFKQHVQRQFSENKVKEDVIRIYKDLV